jgi:general stress protein 26
MSVETVRPLPERKQHALEQLQTEQDVWVATADRHGQPHLVPLSLHWDGQRVVAATERPSRTARNLSAGGTVRLAIGPTRDVLMIKAEVELVPSAQVEQQLADDFAARNHWDPRAEPAEWVYLLMRPITMQAWRTPAELEERTLMRDGHWAV